MTTAHIFCRVIDNHGDLGVCWRLARQLRAEHGLDVTLLVDDLAAFTLLAPEIDPAQPLQLLGDLFVRHWHPDQVLPLPPADLVIEAFACELPPDYIAAMATRTVPCIWINLEYLSAESWVADCHRLPSVHPRTGLTKHFWFPGFTAKTGGLLREAGLIGQPEAQARAVRQDLGLLPNTRLLTLFCYESAPARPLLDALAQDDTPSTLLVFAGKPLRAVSGWLGETLEPGARIQRGQLTLRALPLLPHADYDRLLAAADLNLVRGEDSFVRAQWAGRPMLWHIYAQEAEAHLDKLEAFLTAASPLPDDWRAAMRHWNGQGESNWPAWLNRLPAWQHALENWRTQLLAQPDLATQLMRFHADRVESRPT